MIREMTEDEHYQFKQHLGPTCMKYLLEAIDVLNKHIADSKGESDAGRQTKSDGRNEGLSGAKSGK